MINNYTCSDSDYDFELPLKDFFRNTSRCKIKNLRKVGYSVGSPCYLLSKYSEAVSVNLERMEVESRNITASQSII